MDQHDRAIDLDQADEEILSYTVSDDALEAAAGTERGRYIPLSYRRLASAVTTVS